MLNQIENQTTRTAQKTMWFVVGAEAGRALKQYQVPAKNEAGAKRAVEELEGWNPSFVVSYVSAA